MNSDTQSITINVPPAKLFDFLTNPENMARWASSLCQSVTKDGDQWLLESKMGQLKLRIVSNKDCLTIDYHITPPLPIKFVAYTRIIPNGQASEFLFTQFQLPLLPASFFEKQKESLKKELATLKDIMEGQ
jgi:hypothetical protein